MKKGDRKVALEITRLATVRIYWPATDGYLEGAIRAAGHAAKEVLAGNTAGGAVADRLRAAAVRSALVGWVGFEARVDTTPLLPMSTNGAK